MKTYKVTWYTKRGTYQEHAHIVFGKNAADARKNFEEWYYGRWDEKPTKKPHPFGLTIRLESSKTSGKSDEI